MSHQTHPNRGRARSTAQGRRASVVFSALGLLALGVGAVAQEPDARIGPPGAQAVCDSAAAALRSGDAERAERLYASVLLDQPKHRDALVGMGRVLLAAHQRGGPALDHLKKATELYPEDAEAHYLRGLAHARGASPTIWGRISAHHALSEFDRVIELEPEHHDAHYQKGSILLEVWRSPEAVTSLVEQLRANPSHAACRQTLLEVHMDRGEWNEALSMGRALLVNEPDHLSAFPWLAAAYWKLGRAREAMGVLDAYLPRLPQRERDLYYDLGRILTPADQESFETLDAEGRASFWRHYWDRRDPDLDTRVNERLLEHFIRIAYARIEFGEKIWPWDGRGDVYLRYGEPDLRIDRTKAIAESFIRGDVAWILNRRDRREKLGMTSPNRAAEWAAGMAGDDFGMDVADGSGRPEIWYYTAEGLRFVFDDPVMNRKFLVANESRPLLTAMELHEPSISAEERRYETFDPLASAATFRGEDGNTVLEYAIGLTRNDLTSPEDPGGRETVLEARLELYTDTWHKAAEAPYTARRLPQTPRVAIRGEYLYVQGTRLEVAPGDYVLTSLLLNRGTGRRAWAREPITIPDYTGSDLMVSDILPAAFIRETEEGPPGTVRRNDLDIVPLPGRRLQTDQSLFIYYEIYNLVKDAVGATEFRVEYTISEAPYEGELLGRIYHGVAGLLGVEGRRAVITSGQSRNGIFSDVGTWLEIGMENLPAGRYLLELTVTDLNVDVQAPSRLLFETVAW